MSQVDQLLQQIPVGQIAERVGISEADARQAIDKVVPALVGGMQANAKDPAGAQSLLGALGNHEGQLDARLAGNVDTADGEKIVQNVFGDKTGDIATAMGGGSGMGDVVKKILPIVAPIVIAWIANQYFSGGQQAEAQPADAPFGQGNAQQNQQNDSPFANQQQGRQNRPQVPQPGGQQTPQQAEQSGGGLGDLLGGLLGGGSGSSSSGGGLGSIGDLLGGLLGGGKR